MWLALGFPSINRRFFGRKVLTEETSYIAFSCESGLSESPFGINKKRKTPQ